MVGAGRQREQQAQQQQGPRSVTAPNPFSALDADGEDATDLATSSVANELLQEEE